MSVTFKYGDLEFPEVNIRGNETLPIHHGPDYLYKKTELHLEVLLTPGIIGETFDEFDFRRLDALFEPRQDLELKVDGRTWFKVTAPDAAWGPKWLYKRVKKVVGPKSAWVDLGIEFVTHPVEGEKAAIVMSNRWTMTSHTDGRFWNRNEVVGEAVLRADILSEGDIRVEQLQQALVLPVMKGGYKRENVRVTVSEDGLIARYAFIDSQVPFILMPSYVADADISVAVIGTQQTQDEMAMGALDLGSQSLKQGIDLMAYSANPAAAAATAGVSFTMGSINWLLGTVPTVKCIVTATVQGTPKADMTDLLRVAEYLVIARFREAIPDIQQNPVSLQCPIVGVKSSTRDRVVSYTATISRSAVATMDKRLAAAKKIVIGIVEEKAKDILPAVAGTLLQAAGAGALAAGAKAAKGLGAGGGAGVPENKPQKAAGKPPEKPNTPPSIGEQMKDALAEIIGKESLAPTVESYAVGLLSADREKNAAMQPGGAKPGDDYGRDQNNRPITGAADVAALVTAAIVLGESPDLGLSFTNPGRKVKFL